MHSSSPDPGTTAQGSGEPVSPRQASGVANPAGPGSGHEQRVGQRAAPEPVPAADNPGPGPAADSAAEAQGRRTLSTAFVMAGPDGRLTVELRSGRVLVLRSVVMRRNDYCGVQMLGQKAGGRYCGGYAEVAAARPGAEPVSEEVDPAVSLPPSPAKRN